MKKIRKLYSNSFSEANLKLIGLAPSLYDTLLIVIERIENMDSMELSDEARQELIDIQSVIWDTINADGNLCGVAEWAEKVRYICGKCGATDSGESGFCEGCGENWWIEKGDLDNPSLKKYVDKACKNLSTTREELKKRLV